MFDRTYFRRAPQTPRLVASLRRLARAVDEQWPTRATTSDGWIGDAAHRQRVSDHNPDEQGRVHALDITARGIQPMAVVNAARDHPSTHYVIFNRQIWSRLTEMSARPYEGKDPHTSHVHVSVAQTPRGRLDPAPWVFHRGPQDVV
jgi:hypothetical protein